MTADVDALAEEVAAVNAKFEEFVQRRDELAEMQIRASLAQGYVDDLGEWEEEEPDELVAELPERRRVAALPPRIAVPVPNAAALVAQAMDLAAQQIPDWGVHAPQITARITQNPAALGAAVQTGDPAHVAATLATVYQATKTSEGNRQMKMAAQSAVGASGRPVAVSDDAAEWAKIKASLPGRYWE